MLRGSPAIGKSALGQALCDHLNLEMIDARFAGFDPTDINGFPALNESKGVAHYFPLETFPLDNWELPEGKSGWLLFMDEFNSAPPAVQAASYKLVLDRMVGQRKLHPKVYMMAAGNLDSDNAITHEMSTALISRLVNLQVRHDLESWLEWANGSGKVHSLITTFLQFKGGSFYTFNPDEPNQPFASPRTWEFANRLLKRWQETGQSISSKMPMLAGTISEGVAIEFRAFANLRNDLPTKAEVLADPENCRLPRELGPMYAMTGALADWADEENVEKIIKYVGRLYPADFQVVAIRTLNARNDKFKTHPATLAWMMANMDEFLGSQ